MVDVSGMTRRLTIILLVAIYLNTCHGLKQRRQTPEEDETFRFCGNGNFPGLCFAAERAAQYNCLSLEEDFNCPDETLCCKLSGGKSIQEEKRRAAERLFAKRSFREDTDTDLEEETDLDLEEERDESLEKRVRREDVGKKSGNRNVKMRNKQDNSDDGTEGVTDNDRDGERGEEGKKSRKLFRGSQQQGNRNKKQGNSPPDSPKNDEKKKSGAKVVKVKSLGKEDRGPKSQSQDGRKRGGAGTVIRAGRRMGAGKAANTDDEETPSPKINKDLKKKKKVPVKQQSCKMSKICKKRSGTCRTACLSGEKQKGKCKGSRCKCCIATPSCTITAECKKAKGSCVTKCKKNQRAVTNGCTGDASCLCCGQQCKPKPACTVGGGTCVEKQTDCNGIFQANGCKFGCHCCLPTPTMVPTTTEKPPPTDFSSTT